MVQLMISAYWEIDKFTYHYTASFVTAGTKYIVCVIKDDNVIASSSFIPTNKSYSGVSYIPKNKIERGGLIYFQLRLDSCTGTLLKSAPMSVIPYKPPATLPATPPAPPAIPPATPPAIPPATPPATPPAIPPATPPAIPPAPAPVVDCPRGESYHLTNIYEKCIPGYRMLKDLFGVPIPICVCEKKPVMPPAPPATPPAPAPAPVIDCPRGESYHLTNIYEKCIPGYRMLKDLFGVPIPICVCEKKPVMPPFKLPTIPSIFNYEKISALIPVAIVVIIIILVVNMLRR